MSQLLAGAGAGCCACGDGGGFCNLNLARIYLYPTGRFMRLRVTFSYSMYLYRSGTCYDILNQPTGPCLFRYEATHSEAIMNKRTYTGSSFGNEIRWETCCHNVHFSTEFDPFCFPDLCPGMAAAPNVRATILLQGNEPTVPQCSSGLSDATFRLSIAATHTPWSPGATCVCCGQCGPSSIHPFVSCAPGATYYRRCCNYLNGPIGTYRLFGPSTVVNPGSALCAPDGIWQRTASMTATVSLIP